ncbi:hypothetical protein [Streptomyces sp. MUSC 14]|uniref:hypothetical protein n=1 Tax=Streptomyces sp. MUSC 14 TaxID=1354889 RepID=UPI00116075C9|nr:hypothetical protein [Streptomyces sp. MUSC 14]
MNPSQKASRKATKRMSAISAVLGIALAAGTATAATAVAAAPAPHLTTQAAALAGGHGGCHALIGILCA